MKYALASNEADELRSTLSYQLFGGLRNFGMLRQYFPHYSYSVGNRQEPVSGRQRTSLRLVVIIVSTFARGTGRRKVIRRHYTRANFGFRNMSQPTPPVCPVEGIETTRHGVVMNDPYFWLRERGSEKVLNYLKAENEYTEGTKRSS